VTWLRTRWPVVLQLGGVAGIAVGCGLLNVAAGVISGSVGLLALGIAAEVVP
jgi:hypothetical protein